MMNPKNIYKRGYTVVKLVILQRGLLGKIAKNVRFRAEFQSFKQLKNYPRFGLQKSTWS